jgi:Helix-turn-helix domain
MTQLYDVTKAAELLGIDRRQAYELIWTDQLAWVDLCVKPGGRPRIRVEHTEIERFIKARRSKTRTRAA